MNLNPSHVTKKKRHYLTAEVAEYAEQTTKQSKNKGNTYISLPAYKVRHYLTAEYAEEISCVVLYNNTYRFCL